MSTRKQLHMYIQFCLVPSPIWVAKTQVWPARVMQSWFLKCLASCTLPEGHPDTSLYVTHWQGTAEFLTFFMHAVVLGWLVARSIWRLTQFSFIVFAIVPLLALSKCPWPHYVMAGAQTACLWSSCMPTFCNMALDQNITKRKSRALRMQI